MKSTVLQIENHFTKTMKDKTDIDLVEIIFYKKENYTNEALIAAENELQNRNLEVTIINSFKDKLAIKDTIEQRKATLKLAWGWKLACFFLPGLFTIIVILYYNNKGYEKSSTEAINWTCFGILFYLSFSTIPFVFNILF
jgi:hypothetical protein